MSVNLTTVQLERAIWLAEFGYAASEAGLLGAVPNELPPWLLDPNYVPPTKSLSMYIITSIALFAAVFTVFTRIYARIFISRNFGSDDWFMLFALVICCAFSALQFLFLQYAGVGRHIWDITPEEIYTCFKLIYIHILSYILVIYVIKLSILCLYRRVIPKEHPMQKVVLAFFILHTVYFVIAESIFSFQCGATTSAWDIKSRLTNKTQCLEPRALFYSFGSIHVFLDFLLLFLPIRMVWRLDIPHRKKWSIIVMFAIGFIACLCPIMRMVSLHTVLTGYDLTWNVFQPGMWGCLEVTLGIIIASIPPSRLFYDHLFSKIFSKSTLPLHKTGKQPHGTNTIFEIPRQSRSSFFKLYNSSTPTPEPLTPITITTLKTLNSDTYDTNQRVGGRIASFEDLERHSVLSQSIDGDSNEDEGKRQVSVSTFDMGTFGPSSPLRIASRQTTETRELSTISSPRATLTFGPPSPTFQAPEYRQYRSDDDVFHMVPLPKPTRERRGGVYS